MSKMMDDAPILKVSELIGRSVKNVVWATDLHLDHVAKKPEANGHFYRSIVSLNPDILILAGDTDIAEPEIMLGNLGIVATIGKIRQAVRCPVFFVLGNHDFYGGSIETVKREAQKLTLERDGALYIDRKGPIELNADTALIGADGWCDGMAGNIIGSRLRIADFTYIEDLKVASAHEIFTPKMQARLAALAQPSIDYVVAVLPAVLKQYKNVILVTHVPPFSEAALYEGKPSKDDALPFFVCQGMGEALLKIMGSAPKNNLQVLCGHTHHQASYAPLPNLRVIVGAAEYGKPEAQGLVSLSESP